MATGYNVRVGDADRDAVAAQLREHYADGRLTLDELNERLDQAFAAKTRADLTTVLRDLPYVSRPLTGAAAAGASHHPAWPAGPSGSGWGHGAGYDRRGRPPAIASLMALVWVFLILGAVMLFGIGGGGDRPLAIVLIIAAIAFLRRLFGFGGRRRGYGQRGPRGPKGPRGPRGPRF
jgi:hypothetical protein